GYIGAKTGLSTHLLARYSFGVKGSWLPSLLLGGTQVGWFGVGAPISASITSTGHQTPRKKPVKNLIKMILGTWNWKAERILAGE
ncbi:cytosine permease, partial [Salmonella enterica subsp. enterica serovar Montevideo]|nr:cytosine permease [Salmonella enterica subsp. enterica serovar Montevideo]